ncbi:PAS domain S-box protein [Hankyongella ginsenosidimutans]|uniref:PAS domain S-box protein n=1 Tax=Hankyongella ginsenosidimutans TaxID=1763828 RepID=A0A4D7CB60_9SPHN|nr:PAS domain S-box protein [Hankyongella ginsenosidimutans]QCI79006.1 PAS domain S-box protein [Hankyongella ginsenosidimutans]
MLAAIDHAQAVIEFSLEGAILRANDNFLAVLGYTEAELAGQHHSLFVRPDYARSAEYRNFWTRLGRGESFAAQFERIGKGGKVVWIEASYNPLRDARGNVIGVVKFAIDITARKAANTRLADEFEADVKALVSDVAGSAHDMENTAQSLAASAQQTNQQSSALAAASEELAMSITEISRQLSEATNVVDLAVQLTSRSEEQVGNLLSVSEKWEASRS